MLDWESRMQVEAEEETDIRSELDIFENPHGPPDPRSPKTPQRQKNKFQKTRKPRLSPKVNVRSPKVNAKYF